MRVGARSRERTHQKLRRVPLSRHILERRIPGLLNRRINPTWTWGRNGGLRNRCAKAKDLTHALP